ncbi:MAG: hypothetical protein AAF850_06045 [Pseudomonadota bacterium]
MEKSRDKEEINEKKLKRIRGSIRSKSSIQMIEDLSDRQRDRNYGTITHLIQARAIAIVIIMLVSIGAFSSSLVNFSRLIDEESQLIAENGYIDIDRDYLLGLWTSATVVAFVVILSIFYIYSVTRSMRRNLDEATSQRAHIFRIATNFKGDIDDSQEDVDNDR